MLYHKYRPKTFDEIVGNDRTIESIKADIAKDEVDRPHAILLHGPVGCGKTTLGRLIAEAVGCVGKDFIEVDSADYRGIDTIRDMRRVAQFKPVFGERRAWLLDEVHKTTNDAQNALLKALEEAPTHVYYILATTEPERLLETIRSRCTHYAVAPLKEKQLFRLLRHVAHAEGDSVEEEVLRQIVEDSQGHPRTALQILDKTLSAAPEKRLEVAKYQAEVQNQSIQLCRALISKRGWKMIANILSGLKDEDHETLRRAVMGYCQAILLKEDNVNAACIMEEFKDPLFYSGFAGLVYHCYSAYHTILKGE